MKDLSAERMSEIAVGHPTMSSTQRESRSRSMRRLTIEAEHARRRTLAAFRRAVEVAACGHKEVLVARESAEPRLFLRAVIGMEDLERVESCRGEGSDQRLRLSVPDRMGERRDASGFADRLQHVHGLPLRRGHVPGVLAAEKPIEGVVVG